MSMQVFIQAGEQRISVSSLEPYLVRPHPVLMDPSEMTDEERATCHWMNFGMGKGVTCPVSDISVYMILDKRHSGLHGTLIQGLGNVDTSPACYERDSILGFGAFVRWVYFQPQQKRPGILGIDWSLGHGPTMGVADSMKRVYAVARSCAAHGVPPETELALVNYRVCEDPLHHAWRERTGLVTVRDWCEKGGALFGRGSCHCPQCGSTTLNETTNFCYRCGCEPRLLWNEENSK
jgi:hypothetical protein